MFYQMYHEGSGAKGANNVCSLIVKTLSMMGVLVDGETAEELNIIFDNCSGQNKNNTVLKLLLWLSEMRYFKRVSFNFLIVGHTKNAADRLFNLLKIDYRSKNIYTMKQLFSVLSRSPFVTIIPTEEKDFHDWESYLDLFYHGYTFKGKGIIKEHHIFSCDYSQNRIRNQLFVEIHKSNLPHHTVSKLKVFKTG